MILNYVNLKMLNRKWRQKNSENCTTIGTLFSINNVEVGRGTYGTLNIIYLNENTHIKIGNYCSIANNVVFLGGGEHNYRRISTFPFQSVVYHEKTKENINRDIVVEDDVWIGYDAVILPGVTIGKGSVIGARAIVTKNIPPYSIVVGNSVIVKKRFSNNIIRKIEKIDYSKIIHKADDEYQKFCQVELNDNNVDEIIKSFCDF